MDRRKSSLDRGIPDIGLSGRDAPASWAILSVIEAAVLARCSLTHVPGRRPNSGLRRPMKAVGRERCKSAEGDVIHKPVFARCGPATGRR